MYHFFDTETTGFPNPNLPDDHEKQAHIVQLAGLFTDDEGNIEGAYNFLIQPSGWEIAPNVALIHGITTQKAIRFGIPIVVALAAFKVYTRLAKLSIAHNYPFDDKMTRLESRIAKDEAFASAERPWFCTMTAATPICKLDGKRAGQFKWPKLQETYKHFFNEEFDDAHDAMADVVACKRIFFHMKKENLISV